MYRADVSRPLVCVRLATDEKLSHGEYSEITTKLEIFCNKHFQMRFLAEQLSDYNSFDRVMSE